MKTMDEGVHWRQEWYGKSTDTKPTDAPNSSTFYEMDTKKLYMFDGDTKSWLEQ